ncbi:Hpt domain-containing protein [Pseudovibrio sp. POLY-S9]|uniref:Hpt domain-containing protein n=1 Tax=Pseudovibrio sp. POLY-S9 TaxID=1576596 RepID=UPI000709E5C4|nr:Hpt domain-containing protein [Pseudovibrio sp. POLY-S9]
MTFDDPDLQGQILEMFAHQIEEFRRGLHEAMGTEALRALLHRFKGSARGVGAFALGEALEQAEQEAASGVVPLLVTVETCLTEVSADLSKLQNL